MNKKWFSLLVLFLLCMVSYVSVTANPSDAQQRPEGSDASGTLYHVILKIKDASQAASLFVKGKTVSRDSDRTKSGCTASDTPRVCRLS